MVPLSHGEKMETLGKAWKRPDKTGNTGKEEKETWRK
jgi:hypothetical protein